MEFIFNSRQKKVEIFYNNEKEQKALLEFLNKWMTYKTDSAYVAPEYMNAPEISWTLSSTPVSAAPYTITCDTVADISSAKIDTVLLTNQINSALEKEIKLDSFSSEGGYLK